MHKNIWARVILLVSPGAAAFGCGPFYARFGHLGQIPVAVAIVAAGGTFALWYSCRSPTGNHIGRVMLLGPLLGLLYCLAVIAAAVLSCLPAVLIASRIPSLQSPDESPRLVAIALIGALATAWPVLWFVQWIIRRKGPTAPK